MPASVAWQPPAPRGLCLAPRLAVRTGAPRAALERRYHWIRGWEDSSLNWWPVLLTLSF